MSGLVCVFSRDGAVVDAADVDAVLQRQAHRGPDGLTLWCDGQVGLGYAALDPTGMGRSTGPLLAERGRLAIVGDLRIDNRKDLIDGLDLQDSGVCDAEIVLEAYRRWGVDAAEHLEGGFAFAVCDARRQRVFCARDHLGVKPFTYHLSRELFVCASEAEAVPCHRRVPRRINEARIADFLVSELEGIDHTSTFFEGVERLPPAHFLVIDCDGQRLRRYWQPDSGIELRLESDDAYADAFSEVFQGAVDRSLAGVDKPGVLLSGGIDSGAVAVVARSSARVGTGSGLITYSAIDREDDPTPETAAILTMIEHLQVDHRVIWPSGVAGIPRASRRFLWESGEPFDGSMVVANLLYSMAAADGARVVLDGVDGDIVASTNCPTKQLIGRGRLIRAWREAAGRRRLMPGAPGPLRVMVGGAARALLPNGIVRRIRENRGCGRRVADAIEGSLINRGFAQRIGMNDRLRRLIGGLDGEIDRGARTIHSRAITHPYVAAALERYDRVGAMHGLESHHPFFDLRLVKHSLSLPWDLKTRNGWTKFVLRLAMDGKVPGPVRLRHDYGHVLWRPTSAVIREDASYLQSVLSDHRDELGSYVDPTRFSRIRRALDGIPTQDEEVWIWEATTLAMWLARIRGSRVVPGR